MPLGSQNPSQPDLNLQKPASYACWKLLHTTIQMKKNFCFFRAKIFLFLEKFDENFIFW
jgi:hypothetical protein